MMVGKTGWLTRPLPARRRIVTFAASWRAASGAASLVVGTLGSFWVRAAERHHAIVASLMQDAGRFVVEHCGPGRCVSGDRNGCRVRQRWDCCGALQLAHQDPSLAADTATETLRAGARQLEGAGGHTRTGRVCSFTTSRAESPMPFATGTTLSGTAPPVPHSTAHRSGASPRASTLRAAGRSPERRRLELISE
jgi:hypothetical protein